MESNTPIIENERIGISVVEAAAILGVGRNLMLDLVKVNGFPAIQFKRKIIIDKNVLPTWFKDNYGRFS